MIRKIQQVSYAEGYINHIPKRQQIVKGTRSGLTFRIPVDSKFIEFYSSQKAEKCFAQQQSLINTNQICFLGFSPFNYDAYQSKHANMQKTLATRKQLLANMKKI